MNNIITETTGTDNTNNEVPKYIMNNDPNGIGCATYYRIFADRNPAIDIKRDDFDNLVRKCGYFVSRPSQLAGGRE
jgi:hypothetical protein